MNTLKNVATICLIAALVLAIVAPLFGLNAAASDSAGFSVHNSHVLLDELPTPTPTPTPGAGTDSNPSGGDGGGG